LRITDFRVFSKKSIKVEFDIRVNKSIGRFADRRVKLPKPELKKFYSNISWWKESVADPDIRHIRLCDCHIAKTLKSLLKLLIDSRCSRFGHPT